MFSLITKDGNARRGTLTTPHGTVQTPAFMNVATQAAIKGALSADDLETVGCQIALANTYHLHIRPGDALVRQMGGLHHFMTWQKPMLTDSGGFQIFSLAGLRKICEEGAAFQSHVDGRRIFISPEVSMQIQANLGADIVMAFDECVEIPTTHDYMAQSCARTYRWLVRCRDELERLRATGKPITEGQMLFGIGQGATFADLRVQHMRQIAELDLPGYAIGGLAVGETHQEMYDTVELVEPHMPAHKPRYLMGVGTPGNLIEAVARGIDIFDCVLPARNGRHGNLFTWDGVLHIKNEKYHMDTGPIDAACDCPVCRRYSRAYLRHLFKCGEMLAMRLAVMHNLYFYNSLMAKMRAAIETATFMAFRTEHFEKLAQKV